MTARRVAPSSGRGAVATPRTMGLGVPRGGGGAVTTQVAAHVDAGRFCVQIFAPPPAASAVSFTVALEHP